MKIKDEIRNKERKQEFDDTFVSLARDVYFLSGSNLIEEKSYEQY